MIIYILESSWDWEGGEIQYISDDLDLITNQFNLTDIGDYVSVTKYNIKTQENSVVLEKRFN